MDVGGAGRGLLAVWLFAASPACGGGGEGDGNEPSQMLAGAGAGTSGSAGAAGSMPMGMAGMSAGRWPHRPAVGPRRQDPAAAAAA